MTDTVEEKNYLQQAKEIVAAKTAIALDGGGSLGVAEVGALSRWVELGGNLKNITHVCGASVGSIISTAIAVGADIEYMKKTLFGLDLKLFEDNSFGILRDVARLIKHYGWNKGNAITEWSEKVMCDLTGNPDITFEQNFEATGIHLTTNACSLRFMDTFYLDHITEHNTRLADSIRMSSSIPLFYQAIFREMTLGDLSKVMDCVMDGGTMDNYPIHLLREQDVHPSKIMGLKLCNPTEVREYNDLKSRIRTDYGEVENLKECLVRLITMLRHNAMKQHVHKEDWKLTVKINIGDMSSTDFDMTEEQKQWLYDQGRDAMDAYVEEVAELLKKGKYPSA